MISASVSNIDLFRVWRADEELDLGWILNRILHPEQTQAMKAGIALHEALEKVKPGQELDCLSCGKYRFDLNRVEGDLRLPTGREVSLSKEYGEITVRGRVDGITGIVVTDYKSTEQFDADRLMSGFQWRYYLDMSGASIFRWIVFVIHENEPFDYSVADIHQLEQRRYPELERDCRNLALDYRRFAKEHLSKPVPSALETKLKASLANLGITESDCEAVK